MIDVDVLIVGAGISGIGAAYHLGRRCPDKSVAIVEARADIGGTWDLFRYPGIRSDSDMHTLGFSFKPWVHERSIADGPSILEYLRETVDEFDIGRLIHFGRRVRSAAWSSDSQRWEVAIENGDEIETARCDFLFVCTGYYRYSEGHTPDFAGREEFGGTIVHPQHWPEDLDVDGARVVVIGSGATAVTLVPALAERGAQVTMLQRSPSYVVSQPDVDPVALALRERLPERVAYTLTRARNLARDQMVYRLTRTKPEKVRADLLARVGAAIGRDQTEAHFTPTYDPWDERLCLVPNGDLFEAINAGTATVVTDHIDTFTESGIRLRSGAELDADIIVTATGLHLVPLGEIEVSVDGEPVDIGATWSYRGVGYSGIPNLASIFGYVNASWTLRSDMVARFVCRLLNHMDRHGHRVAVPTVRPEDSAMTARPWIDGFAPGYMRRAHAVMPRQGDREPWVNHQTYVADRRSLLHSRLDDGALVFS